MRIVLDSNVLISAFVSLTGTCQHVFSITVRQHMLILSPFVLEEFTEKLTRKIGMSEEVVKEYLFFLKNKGILLDIETNPKIQFSDPKDIPLLSLVKAAGPHYFVTGDKKLLLLKKFEQTLIITPREAIQILKF